MLLLDSIGFGTKVSYSNKNDAVLTRFQSNFTEFLQALCLLLLCLNAVLPARTMISRCWSQASQRRSLLPAHACNTGGQPKNTLKYILSPEII